MAISDVIISTVASEQMALASILSAEAVKASSTANWISLVATSALLAEAPNVVISKAIALEGAIADVINSTANKEIAIAAKVAAVLGQPVNINWSPMGCCGSDNDC